MNNYCTCNIEIISLAGFSMRNGVAYCNSCQKPESSTSPQAQVVPVKSGNALSGLFDLNFQEFVSVSYFKLIYAITLVLWTLVSGICLLLIWMNFSILPAGLVVLASVGIPLVYLLMLIYTRMSIELIVNLFRIGKDIQHMRENQ